MANIKIQLKGVGVELALGNYPKTDTKIFEEWTEFFNYNNLVHNSHLIVEHLSAVIITEDEIEVYNGKIKSFQLRHQKSHVPNFEQGGLYLRTECVEQAVYQCAFTTDRFDISKLIFETQDFDQLFKTGKSFLTNIHYQEQSLELEWISAEPIGNICLLCRYENAYLLPIYDAITKTTSKTVDN
jgi:hypothetical protein